MIIEIEIGHLWIKLGKGDVPEEQTPLDVAEEFVEKNFDFLQLDLKPSRCEKRRTSARKTGEKLTRKIK